MPTKTKKSITVISTQEQLGKMLSEARRKRGYVSMQRISYAVNLDPSQICRIENGKQWPKFKQLQDLAGELGFEICLREK